MNKNVENSVNQKGKPSQTSKRKFTLPAWYVVVLWLSLSALSYLLLKVGASWLWTKQFGEISTEMEKTFSNAFVLLEGVVFFFSLILFAISRPKKNKPSTTVVAKKKATPVSEPVEGTAGWWQKNHPDELTKALDAVGKRRSLKGADPLRIAVTLLNEKRQRQQEQQEAERAQQAQRQFETIALTSLSGKNEPQAEKQNEKNEAFVYSMIALGLVVSLIFLFSSNSTLLFKIAGSVFIVAVVVLTYKGYMNRKNRGYKVKIAVWTIVVLIAVVGLSMYVGLPSYLAKARTVQGNLVAVSLGSKYVNTPTPKPTPQPTTEPTPRNVLLAKPTVSFESNAISSAAQDQVAQNASIVVEVIKIFNDTLSNQLANGENLNDWKTVLTGSGDNDGVGSACDQVMLWWNTGYIGTDGKFVYTSFPKNIDQAHLEGNLTTLQATTLKMSGETLAGISADLKTLAENLAGFYTTVEKAIDEDNHIVAGNIDMNTVEKYLVAASANVTSINAKVRVFNALLSMEALGGVPTLPYIQIGDGGDFVEKIRSVLIPAEIVVEQTPTPIIVEGYDPFGTPATQP